MTDTPLRSSRQESHSKLKPLSQTAPSLALCFPAKENKRPFKIQSVTRAAALDHHFGGKAGVWRGGSSQHELCDAFEPVALLPPQGQWKLPGNSPRTVRSPGPGYNMYIHEVNSSYLTALTRRSFTPQLVSETENLPLESLFEESSKVIFRKASKVTRSMWIWFYSRWSGYIWMQNTPKYILTMTILLYT